MKKIITSVAFGVLTVAGWSQTMEVVIQNVDESVGNIAVALYSNEADFMKKRFAGKIVQANKGDVHVLFENIPAGEYAISTYHDVNANGELDKNFIGIPKEGFGFSNNAMGTFGPPDFKKASFAWRSGQVVTLSLRHY